MPKINGTRPAAAKSVSASAKKPVAHKKTTASTASRASGGEGASVSTRSTSVSSYSGGGEGGGTVSRPVSKPVVYPARNLWSSGGGGE